MGKLLRVAFSSLAVVGSYTGAMAAQQIMRVRGTITSVNGNTLAIKSYSGKTVDVTVDSGTKYAWVTPSSLSNVKSGDFIGTAATGPEDNMKAQEVVIFPNSMRGTGEGHYSWSMPAAIANADAHGSGGAITGSSSVHGTMTNGTVHDSMTTGSVHGSMTNGTVATNSNRTGGTELTISYNKGNKVEILVPTSAPIVQFVPADKSVLSPGAKTFILGAKSESSGEQSANFVAVGKNGLMPPM